MKFCPSCKRLVPTIEHSFKELEQWWSYEECHYCGDTDLEEPSHCVFCGTDIARDEKLCDSCLTRLDQIISGAIMEIEEEMTDDSKYFHHARELLEERLNIYEES